MIYGYKGFYKTLRTFNNFQYEIGHTYEISGDPKVGEYGFHFSPSAYDCIEHSYLRYEKDFRICRIQAEGKISVDASTNVYATSKITILEEVDLSKYRPLYKKYNRLKGIQGLSDGCTWMLALFVIGCLTALKVNPVVIYVLLAAAVAATVVKRAIFRMHPIEHLKRQMDDILPPEQHQPYDELSIRPLKALLTDISMENIGRKPRFRLTYNVHEPGSKPFTAVLHDYTGCVHPTDHTICLTTEEQCNGAYWNIELDKAPSITSI